MRSIAIAPTERKCLIAKMKRESKPSRRLRMHIILLASEDRSPTEITRFLFCSRTTVYAVIGRFAREGRAAFDDHARRGPKPLLGDGAGEHIGHLVEEDSPTDHGWLRSRWSCKLLALQLLRERAAVASRETIRRALHHLGFRWRRPRPVPPERDAEEQMERKRARLEDVLSMAEKAGSFFQDETKLETNPKVASAGCEKESRSPSALRGPTARCGSAGR